MFGNHGRILKVDLSAGKTAVETPEEAFYRMFLGGNGVAAKLIRDAIPDDADPAGTENALVFSVWGKTTQETRARLRICNKITLINRAYNRSP